MQRSVSSIGGGRIGPLNATWPFARFTATSMSLTLKVWPFGTFTFNHDQVISLERYVHIPLIGWGVRINHIVPQYPEKIVFWSLGNPGKLIQEVQGIGFSPAGSPSNISYEDTSNIVKHPAIPTALTAIGLWTILFFIFVYYWISQ